MVEHMQKKFHVYKDKQNVKVDIGHKWSSEEDTLLVLCKVVHPFLLAFYFCCNKKIMISLVLWVICKFHKNPRGAHGLYVKLSRGSFYDIFALARVLQNNYKIYVDVGSSFTKSPQHCPILTTYPHVNQNLTRFYILYILAKSHVKNIAPKCSIGMVSN
jgi:hypothetical protein